MQLTLRTFPVVLQLKTPPLNLASMPFKLPEHRVVGLPFKSAGPAMTSKVPLRLFPELSFGSICIKTAPIRT